MAWVYSHPLGAYTGLSSVPKPTQCIDKDTLAYEYDTKAWFIFDGVSWVSKDWVFKGNESFRVSKSITRPNDTAVYAAGDVIGTATSSTIEFENVGSAGNKITIDQATLRIDTNAIPAGLSGFRLHLYNAAPTPIADNAAFNVIAADRGKYLGYIPIGMPSDLGDTLFSQELDINMKIVLASTSLFGVLETAGAFTPTANCVKTITLK